MSKEVDTENSESATRPFLAQPVVICRASFKGEVTKEQLYIILNYIDDMKNRGYFFEKHGRTDMANGNVKIDYMLVKHGI